MDVYFPDSGGPWPALVYVHGGSWMRGDKSEAMMFAGNMTSQGYLVVSINYRLYPPARFPAMIEDVKCAVRSLRAHAGEYNLDPDRIGAFGVSAGGHLVSLLGTSDQSDGWDVGEYLGQSSRVKAVIAMAPVTDLSRYFPNADIEATLAKLRSLPGVGEWTAQYIAMRALAWPDAFPHTDLGVMKALGEKDARRVLDAGEAWRPWRAYAVMHLWNSLRKD